MSRYQSIQSLHVWSSRSQMVHKLLLLLLKIHQMVRACRYNVRGHSSVGSISCVYFLSGLSWSQLGIHMHLVVEEPLPPADGGYAVRGAVKKALCIFVVRFEKVLTMGLLSGFRSGDPLSNDFSHRHFHEIVTTRTQSPLRFLALRFLQRSFGVYAELGGIA